MMISILILMIGGSCTNKDEADLKIGLIADPQYEYKDRVEERYYKKSLWKLKQAIDTFNNYQVDFVQNLGDIINGQRVSYDSIIPIYKNLNPEIENYHLLGNHDFSIDSVQMPNLLEILSMPDFYYSYVKKNWRFIVLDATDVSYYANAFQQRTIEEIDAYYKLAEGKENHHPWNSGIGKKQQDWMVAELEEAQSLNQKVILFSHMPLRPEHMTNLWNYEEIAKIIEGFPNVVAFINGHNHEGGHVFHNGIHYITIFGMLDTEISSYGILDIYQDSLVIKGYGNQKSLSLIIHSSDK